MNRQSGSLTQPLARRRAHIIPLAIPYLTLALAMVMFPVGAWPGNATAGGLSHIQDAGAQAGQNAPSGGRDGMGARGDRSSGSDDEMPPKAGSKDKNLGGGNPGPGCPFQNQQLELIV